MRSEIKFGTCTLLAMASIVVTGCSGGGKSTTASSPVAYVIGGTVTGLNGAGLVLQNGGGDNLTVSASATSFSFSARVPVTGLYSVTVLTQPAGESCTVANGSGIASANVTNIAVTCTSLDTIGGTITGLSSPGLVLEDNGGDSLTITSGATRFRFPTPIANGSAYDVSVLSQPLGENCAVSNGSGQAAATVTNVTVTCTPVYQISGTITGLMGAGLVLQDNGGDNLTVSANATSFTFPTAVLSGGGYSITVLTQPASENCSVFRGSSTAKANVTNASVVCVGDWTWTAGSSTVGLNGGMPGVYGILGTPALANLPGGREQATTWTDTSGNVWLFGGNGPDSAGTQGQLNDLWKFDPTSGANGEWTWINGSAINVASISSSFPAGAPGVYGTVKIASPTNIPGGREQCANWKDASGNLWLFGGIGIDANGIYGFLNDLWKFDPKASEWTWMGGSSTAYYDAGQPGAYGTKGMAASTNTPGGRYGPMYWTDASGNFWLFGGTGTDSANANGYLNDLWEYTPGDNGSTGEWTWVGGSNTLPVSQSQDGSSAPGVYGTLGTAAPANVPGGRTSGANWTDATGNLWLFGGLTVDSTGNTAYLNDLWEYTSGAKGVAGEWTWMGGSKTAGSNGGQPGVYGIQGTTASANIPGARFSSAAWVDGSGDLWLLGGQGYDWTDTLGLLNDLWKYTPGAAGDLGQWTWMGGSDAVPQTPFVSLTGQSGVYGTLGTPAPANTPGGRFGASSWIDASGSLRLFGGRGYDSTGIQGELNDSWQYQP